MSIPWKPVLIGAGVTLASIYIYHHWIMKKTVVPQALVPAAV